MTSTVLSRVDRDVVVVSGPDATSFLQSLLSQDLDPIAVGETTHALLLEPRGKLVVDLRALHFAADEWCCICEAGFGSALAEGLKRFKIRVKVEIEDRSDETATLTVRGADAVDLVAKVTTASPGLTASRIDWATDPGVELFGAASDIDAAVTMLTEAGGREIDDDAYETLRIEAGVPRQGFDIDESTIAQEAFLERDAVSFTKGCFLGQELVCRIDSRGHVNRLLRRLRADTPIPRGSAVIADEKEVGTITSDSGTVALATLRRSVEPEGWVTVRTDAGDVAAKVEAVEA